MKRRKAIGRILLAGVGAGAIFSGYKWYDWHKSPDLAFTSQHKELIAALAETIIPATDTPGAREAGVADYIIIMIRDCTNKVSQNKFIDGLSDVEKYCQSTFSRSFTACSPAEKESVLRHFEEAGRPMGGMIGKAQTVLLGKSFFAILKQYTVEGYCSSEAGATKGLSYLYIPGRFQGCIPMMAGQKAWATK